MKKLLRKGFTIVELVIVIAVIAILAGVLIPTFSGVVDKANKSSALQKATSVMKSTLAMNTYGTIAEGTQFIIVSGEKVAYKFEMDGNSIKESSEKNLPSDWNSLIVKGVTNDSVTVLGTSDMALINAILDSSAKLEASDFSLQEGVYKVTSGNTKIVYGVVKAGEAFDSNAKYYTKGTSGYTEATGLSDFASDTTYYKNIISEIKIYINTDYASDVITVTKSN